MRATTVFRCVTSSLAVALLCGSARAQCPNDDTFEDNDDCASAVALGSGLLGGLQIHGQAHPNGVDADFWSLQVPATGGVSISAGFNPFVADIDLVLYADDGTCLTAVAFGTPSGGGEGIFYLDNIGLTADFYLAVVPADPLFVCNDYDLFVSFVPPTGNCPNPDVYEPNGTPPEASPLSQGTTTGPAINGDFDQDFWTYTVAPGEQFIVNVLFSHADGDIDAQLLGVSGPNVFGGSHDDNESIGYTNNTAAPVVVTLLVYSFSVPNCAEYSLQVGPGEVGTRMCFGDGLQVICPCGNESIPGAQQGCMNSTGNGAQLTASGTAFVAMDNLVFSFTGARSNQPTLLVQGAQLITIPFKDGQLCTGSPTERIEVVFSDATGAGSTSSSIVTGGNIPGPGVTRYYQHWYRDPIFSPCGTGSNFTSGVEIEWL
jgi:hypothetical protein